MDIAKKYSIPEPGGSPTGAAAPMVKKRFLVHLYGAVIILQGVFLLLSAYTTFSTTRYIVGIASIAGATFALITAYLRQKKQAQFAYHEMHALTMFVYGVSVLVFADTVEMLSCMTAFLLFFYAISEIAFCNWLFNLESTVKYKILFVRIFLGLLVGVGTIVLLNYDTISETIGVQGYGILFALIGVNVLLYEPIIKKNA